MRARGYPVFSPELPPVCAQGFFLAPTLIEIPAIEVLGREIFGPVLQVLIYQRDELEKQIEAVNALGYGLTFGIHSRIEETITSVTSRIQAGNIYVNRNIIGAVVGSQPFGGQRLSGTGPKAGGPLYLRRVLAECPAASGLPQGTAPKIFQDFLDFLRAQNIETAEFSRYGKLTPLGAELMLPGPVGEQNQYLLAPRGRVLCRAGTEAACLRQIAACLTTGNIALVHCTAELPALQNLPAKLAAHIHITEEIAMAEAALFDGDASALRDFMGQIAAQTHAIVPVQALPCHGRPDDYRLENLLAERSVCVNTAAAGGNASLMTIG